MGVFDNLNKQDTSPGGVFGRLDAESNKKLTKSNAETFTPNTTPGLLRSMGVDLTKTPVPKITKPKSTLQKTGDVLAAPFKFVDRLSKSGVAFLTPDAPYIGKDGKMLPGPTPKDEAMQRLATQDLGNGIANKAADFLGQGAAFFLNPAATESGIIQNSAPLASKLGQAVAGKIENKLGSKIVGGAVQGATTGGVYGVASPFISGDTSLSSVPKSVAENAGVFAGLDGASPLIGKGVQLLASKYAGTKLGDAIGGFFGKSKPVVPESVGPTLALPEGRGAQRMNAAAGRGNLAPNETPIQGTGDIHTFALPESPQYNEIQRIKSQQTLGLPPASDAAQIRYNKMNGNVLPTNETPIQGHGDIHTFGLPEGNYTAPQRFKVTGKQDSFHSAMEKVFPAATEKMTPPLENPNELAKWVRGHMNKAGYDISLNEVRTLDYNDLYQLATEIQGRLKTSDVVRQTAYEMGYGKIFDQTAPTLKEQLAQDLHNQVYGIYPNKVNIKRPDSFNIQHENPAAMPANKVGSFGRAREAKPTPVSDTYRETPEQTTQRATQQLNESADRKKISDLSKPLIGRAAMPETNIGFKPVPKQPSIPDIAVPDSVSSVKKAVNETVKKIDSLNAENIHDLSGFNAQTRDVYRNLEATLGPGNAKPYIESLNAAKSDNINMQEDWTNKLKTEVVDKLGIQKGGKLSALVQKYGENNISLEQLKAAAPKDWEKVVEADKWFRDAYNKLIDTVNESRQRIYPNNPDKIVPKRKDYYRHFKDLQGLAGLKNLFETPAQISPGLSGISEFVKPKSKFAGFMQKRGLGSYKNDAVGGFLEYIPSASYSTHIDPQINKFRELSKSLAEVTDETRNANNLIEYLHDYANHLSGKTNPADRFVQKIIGRRTMGIVRWINNRVKTNTILGNVGSLVAQLGNVPNGIAAAKQYSIKGMGDTLASVVNREGALVNQSPFLKERYYNTREFDTRWIQQPRKLASWAIETADRIGTEFTWNSMHAKGVADKVADPIAYADDMTRKLVAGRGVGEQPLLQSSTVYQVLAPFTLEVANAWRVMGGFVKNKDAGAIVTLFLASYMFNKAAEQVRGSGVLFDPIQAIYEAAQPGLTPLERAGRIAGEVISNLPFGQQIASAYPEYGSGSLPTRKQLFGDNDPTRFGEGLAAIKGIQDPLYKLLPSFGGNQLKKTIQGSIAISRSGSEKKGKLSFPIERTPAEVGKALLFRPNATSAGQKYYDNARRPLSVQQTDIYKSLPKDKQAEEYKSLMMKRLEDNAQQISKDVSLTEKQRKEKIADLQRKFNELKKN